MKTFDIRGLAGEAREGEYVFGYKDTGSHACYMIYGELKPGERGRRVRPGPGHEEMVLAQKGDLVLTGRFEGTLSEGTAFHIVGDDECFLENPSDDVAVYIIAGGHSGGGH